MTEAAGAPNGWLVQTRGLTKRFGGLVAVDDLPLAVRPGEIRGLIGPNGSGKTTTVNLLSGLYRADAGEIRLRGERIDRLRPHQITARGVARTFQTPKLFGQHDACWRTSCCRRWPSSTAAATARCPRSSTARVGCSGFVTLDGHRHAPGQGAVGRPEHAAADRARASWFTRSTCS